MQKHIPQTITIKITSNRQIHTSHIPTRTNPPIPILKQQHNIRIRTRPIHKQIRRPITIKI